MQIVRCPRCAKEIPDSASFCRRCGCEVSFQFGGADVPPPLPFRPVVAPRVVAHAYAPAPGPSTLIATAPPPPRPARRKGSGGVYAFFLVAGGLLFGFLTFTRNLSVKSYPTPATPQLNAVSPVPSYTRPYPMPSGPFVPRPLPPAPVVVPHRVQIDGRPTYIYTERTPPATTPPPKPQPNR